MKLVRIVAIALLSLSLVNCSMDISVEDLSGPDFLKSSVLSQTEGVADGLTDMVVVLELRNSDDTLVSGHTPVMSLLSGITVTLFDCTESNESGISTCTIRSNIAGTATVQVGNIKIDLEFEAEFMPPPRSGTFMQIVSSAQNNQDASGYKVTSQVGAPFSGLYQEASGYKIYTNTTGGVTPTE